LTQQRLAFPISISNNQIKKKMHTLIQTPTQQHFSFNTNFLYNTSKNSLSKSSLKPAAKRKKKKSKAKEKKGANHLIVEDCPICFSAKHQHEHEHDIMSLVFIGQFR